jgi:hypothetical protein
MIRPVDRLIDLESISFHVHPVADAKTVVTASVTWTPLARRAYGEN